MSKNVAVFVDVANIFYAAKAAGVDIDYVTLLKSATAGRDFVRAYAYTGLDPENENQRQFHSFLARSGYKVVSKDIRKYGDGRIKANLDIELVVDMMRMAEKLDIAVVVSGDGDFAPAINAVQQQGVRVEVISFRGNTSSDLIDAADIFIDISNIARVEKGARSGRRVAAEGDLSMTEVPDKESGVTPRRRRRDGEERPERSERTERSGRRRSPAVAASLDEDRPVSAGLVALPGEKLSRGLGSTETAALPQADAEVDGESDVDALPMDDGRRRRRRRGGRGRGRAVRPEGEEARAAEPDSDTTDFPDEVPTLPQHSSFGSVWDRQIGVPTERPAAGPDRRGETPSDDELPEPDVPEYLLAERRQQGRGQGRGGRAGRSGGYRSAIDRERYGVGSRSGFTRGGVRGTKSSHQASPGRASAHAMAPIEQTPGGDPWSEVPPDVQELLRAELARRQAAAVKPASPGPAEAVPTGSQTAIEAATPARSTRRRSSRSSPEASSSAATAAEAPAATEEAKPKRRTRKRTTAAGAAPEADAPAPTEEAKPKRTTRKRTTAAAFPEEA